MWLGRLLRECSWRKGRTGNNWVPFHLLLRLLPAPAGCAMNEAPSACSLQLEHPGILLITPFFHPGLVLPLERRGWNNFLVFLGGGRWVRAWARAEPGGGAFSAHPPWRKASQVALVVKNVTANAGDIRDPGLIPGSGRSPGEGHGNPLQCSCLESPTDRETPRVGHCPYGHKVLGKTEVNTQDTHPGDASLALS